MSLKNKPRGFTLIEVLGAIIILGTVIVPLIIYMGDALKSNLDVERRVRSTLLAEGEVEKINTALYNSYTTSFTNWPLVLSDNYLVSRTLIDQTANLKRIVVAVGYDTNLDNTLASNEILITLTTLYVKRT